jgi:hypothetical protein
VRMVLAAVFVVVAGSCTGAPAPDQSASPVFSSVVPLSHARISALWLLPYPEGPSAYFCPHPERMTGISTCLRLSRAAVTGVLGSPVAWPASTPSHDCETGWTMKVIFVDGARLVYGPCDQPSSIIALRDALLQAAAPN